MLEELDNFDKHFPDIDIGVGTDSLRLRAVIDVDKLGSWYRFDLVQRSRICHDMAALSLVKSWYSKESEPWAVVEGNLRVQHLWHSD